MSAAAKKEDVNAGLRQTCGGLLFAMGVVVLLSLLTYDWHDIKVLSSPRSEYIHNCFGLVGAWLAFILFMSLGLSAYLLPFWCMLFACLLIFQPEQRQWSRLVWTVVFSTALALVLDLSISSNGGWIQGSNMPSGGVLINAVAGSLLIPLIERSGTLIIASIILLVSLVKLIGIGTVVTAARDLAANAQEWKTEQDEKSSEKAGGRSKQIDRQSREIEKKRAALEETVRREEQEAELRAKSQEGKLAEAEKVKQLEKAKLQEKAKQLELDKQQEKAKLLEKAKQLDKAKQLEQARQLELTKERGRAKAVADAALAVKGESGAFRLAQTDQTFQSTESGKRPYQLPPVTLLDELPPAEARFIKGDSATTGHIIKETLAEFDIQTEVTNVEQGPAVTRYELLPAAGVRVERIASLSNNLALALKATSVLIQAPVPGKGVVGVEVPNAIASMVFLRDLMEGNEWQTSKAALPLALGKDVSGADVVADLAAMPHLLIAGATGSGKSVCMHSCLLGLLMRCTPDHLRLMLVDPKIVEFSGYNKLPHLVSPVITDPRKVAIGLRWAINEMEKRYKLFARAGVRNIESYNTRPEASSDKPSMTAIEAEPLNLMPGRIAYIVVVVDELADLMLVAAADIENCIARLAQLSRAVGIHMILATQRPSVNIITGTIKANFPARIAFQVAQRTDSRTILDANGADNLLGRGDMLFLPPASNRMIRAQGCFVTDAESKRVLEFIRAQGEPSYQLAIQDKGSSEGGGDAGGSSGGSMDDGVDTELLEQSIQIIRETKRASTSSLQRRLRIGYTRAARIMDILEERGIVGPPRGSDPREILIDLDVNMGEAAPESPEKVVNGEENT